MDMYIYYRVRSDRARDLHGLVRALQADLSQRHGIAAELKRRPDEKNGFHTWMEVYLGTPSGFDAILEQAVAETELAMLIDGERHVEYFLDAASCA
jgi:hypothetical protein